ncbi:S8/S53 family peptidase [Thiolapillus sp.]
MRTRQADRLLRFALQTTRDIDEKALLSCIEIALGTLALEYMPELLRVDKSFWDYHAKTGHRPDQFDYRKKDVTRRRAPYLVDDATLKKRHELVKNGKPPGLPLKLRPFMTDRKTRSPKLAPGLGRHQFFILTIPYYEGTFRREQCKPQGTLFDIGYQLQKKCGLASVVPDLQYPHYQVYSTLLGDFRQCPEGTDSRWHLDNIAYDAVPANIDGSGIRIGHPDTGWTPHEQLNFTANGSSPNYDLGADVNIFDPGSASAEEAVPSAALNAHHGTATGGLLISNADNQVNGLAPGATVVSIRAVNSVVLIGDINVARAIVAAVDAGAQVISISLGGYPAPLLEWSIAWAVANNVIVVAAAGNQWPFVVYPAAYPSCIAVGGSTIEDTVWEGSARDYLREGLIDISAPSECVHNPGWRGNEPSSGPGRGTSFGTAIVAGAAALWLQRFNRNNLISALAGRSTLQELFRAHLRQTARRPAGWNTGLDGPGILNLRGLMDRRTLPNPRRFPFPPIVEDIGNLLGVDMTANAGNRFVPPTWIETVFGSNAASVVDQVGEELITMMMTDPVLASLVLAIDEAAENIEQAAEDAADAVGNAQQAAEEFVEDTIEETEELVEEFIDQATDTASDVVNEVTGWFGL